MYGGGVVKERITHYEPGRRMTVNIIDAGRFARQAAADIEVVPKRATRLPCHVHDGIRAKVRSVGLVDGQAHYGPAVPRLGWPDLDGLATHLDTGQRIGRKGIPVPVQVS